MKRMVVLVALPLMGCMSSTNWQHSAIVDVGASERQFTIDNGLCRQVAMGAAPMPPMPQPHPQQTGYDVTARTATYGSFGPTYSRTSATVTPRSGGFAGGMASGLATGAALRQQIDTRRAQGEIFDGCMYRLGWMKG